MEQEILTLEQKKILEAVAQEKNMQHFYLSGGTALAAYYLSHRVSDDLDFFIFDEPEHIFLHGFAETLKNLIKAQSMRFERRYDRNQFFFSFGDKELKVEFTKYPFQQLETPLIKNGLKIDSLRDIAANKFMAMLDRFDPKDYVDLFFLLQQFSLEQIRKDVEKKFGIQVGPIFLGSELAKSRRIEALPHMVKPLTMEELKAFFIEHAKKLSSEIFIN